MSAEAAVEAFFVISGFYMALTFEAHYRGADGVWKFYLSRVVRLYPLYIAVLALMAAIFPIARALRWPINATHSFDYFMSPVDGFQQVSVWSLFFQDILSIDPVREFLLPLRQAWSISAELAFYLLTPALLLLRKSHLAVLATVCFAIKGLILNRYGFRAAYFPFPPQLGYFLLGILIYRLRDRLAFERRTAAWLATGFCLLAVSRLDLSFESLLVPVVPVPNIVLIGTLCLAMPSATMHFRGRTAALLGDMSYGVYIMHLVVIDLLRALPLHVHRSLFTLLAITVAAALSMTFELTVQSRIDALRRRLFYTAGRTAT
ncbi:MAG: acyltransferase [Alphaproteobacteria bacterium]|nr:acyltransferase [Alphaproteobacteria bacterium]